ncbi:unnamed protein product [Protopolystoma xenopodis]|uniref:Uncharacterized protein n=1 Tax=Protopolystoma xenopodis TaxID=117903 RepID=A0A448WK75_9PLAT|nr:unnamed protein product [Protopolystoma xenopodis]
MTDSYAADFIGGLHNSHQHFGLGPVMNDAAAFLLSLTGGELDDPEIEESSKDFVKQIQMFYPDAHL